MGKEILENVGGTSYSARRVRLARTLQLCTLPLEFYRIRWVAFYCANIARPPIPRRRSTCNQKRALARRLPPLTPCCARANTAVEVGSKRVQAGGGLGSLDDSEGGVAGDGEGLVVTEEVGGDAGGVGDDGGGWRRRRRRRRNWRWRLWYWSLRYFPKGVTALLMANKVAQPHCQQNKEPQSSHNISWSA